MLELDLARADLLENLAREIRQARAQISMRQLAQPLKTVRQICSTLGDAVSSVLAKSLTMARQNSSPITPYHLRWPARGQAGRSGTTGALAMAARVRPQII